MSSYFPFFADIEGKSALIVGGGKVAARKVEKLLPYGPVITVVSPTVCDEILKTGVEIIYGKFEPEMLSERAFVIAATNDKDVNRKISDLCKERRIPVNSVDDREACSFVFPALVKDGNVSIGISTGGSSPTAAVWIKEKISSVLPEGLGDAVDTLEKAREEIKPCFPSEKLRSEYLRELLENLMKRGKVYIVGAGCGEYDLITVRGLNAIKNCDVVIYDDLIDERLLDEAPRRAETVYVGKRQGKHSTPQEEINDLLIKYAREGKTVVRLKGGDPFVFGRGGEEILALKENGIEYEEIPGISSAIAIPAFAGIPVTHREVSRSVHIITAHTAKDNDELPEWYDELASLPGTLVFLMGLTRLQKIAKRLMQAGKSGNTPAAVISGGNSPNKVTVRATLRTIAKAAKEAKVQSPAVIVVGDVAALDLTYTGVKET